MKKNKGARTIITLECECRNKTRKTTLTNKDNIFRCRYTTSKNKRNTPYRLEVKKFCKYCNCHKNFKEIK